ncbi:conserved hypothetical protein [Ricinus communis]|uniref:Uncharacterized protein n=1 Tax=Ricinus communis TaxID=3988 RepID=B9S8K2_RICCO|nr:conserved hypothetical protein [Ricinus communis]
MTDELEILQSKLAISKDRISVSSALISELELQLESTNMSIKSRMEEELQAKKLTDEITEACDETCKTLEMIKREIYEERRARSKLKQVLRMRKQTIRALQVTLQAVEMESEAFGASTSESIGHIKNSETDNSTVQLPQDEYYALRERAMDETALGEWRISIFLKQKLAAQESRNFCLSRLEELSTKKGKEKKINEDGNIIKEVEQQSPTRGTVLPKVRDEATDKLNQDLRKRRRRSRSTNTKNNKKLRKK